MPFQGFEGPAGTGKTHSLIEAVVARVDAARVAEHQRVLALTFMHGSRRRLEERLGREARLRGRYLCMTIDSFAAQVAHRWRSLAESHNAHAGDFNQTCNACGCLLEVQQIAKWVAAAYPVVIVDEAQELGVQRLRVIRALEPHVDLYVAADEFQCLDEAIDTAPCMAWFQTGQITRLQQVHRTTQQGLLAAGTALRDGRAPMNGAGLAIRYEFPNQMPFAIGHALNEARRNGASAALIVAPGSRPWANELIPRLTDGLRSARQAVLPLRIGWEAKPDDEVDRVLAVFESNARVSATEILQRLGEIADQPHWLSLCIKAVAYQLRVIGQEHWSLEALRDMMGRKAALQRAYGYQPHSGIPVVTIGGAKNRQFRNVVVLWGPGVRGDAEQQRKLLYNAITRTEARCTIFVRTRELLAAAPFTAF
jgi:superfamily I DNA/RNA helicase